jgi:HSP20 family protein
MNLVKWSPFRELEDVQTHLNRFFNETPGRRVEGDGLFFADWAPPVDIHETDKEYVIRAELPAIKKEDVKVEMLDGVLTIEGERRQEKEEKGKKCHKMERSYGRFVRQFVLPNGVDTRNVQAEFKEGMLDVHLPKAAEAKPKTVEVKVA